VCKAFEIMEEQNVFLSLIIVCNKPSNIKEGKKINEEIIAEGFQ
jgi:hypothetical protein